MDVATGAMNTLLPKLAELVVGEYKLQKGVNGEIKELEKELESMSAALHNVAEVPAEQLDELANIWASDVRELSYDIEDTIDTFMLRGKGNKHTELFSLKGIIGKATNLYSKAKTNHQIHNMIEDIMGQVKVISDRRGRYNVDGIAARPNAVTVDPRLEALYRKATELVGIHGPKNELAKRLFEQDCSSRQQPYIISIVGFGGLGKTTLANSLLQDHKAQFYCHFFVSVSLNTDIKKIFKRMLHQLDQEKYASIINDDWDEVDLINMIRQFLKGKRCLCVIDDVWKESAWDTIKLALQDGSHGSKIIITTRNKAVAEHVGGGVYELQPLSNYDSNLLLNKRIFDAEDGCPHSLREVTGKILKKCGGVPLAIITIASLLASKPRHLQDWEKVNNSIGFGLEKNPDVEKMKNILCLSYNDLPPHLKTCLLYLGKYPEDMGIRKDVLILSWLAEGFITHHGEPSGKSLPEIGEGYFNELINRSLIQPLYNPFDQCYDNLHMFADTEVHACRVHDMVLELINHLSAEEGFVTTLLSDGKQASNPTTAVQRRKIRRLSLHIHDSTKPTTGEWTFHLHASQEAREQLFKMRSLDVFGDASLMPDLSRFHVLRVLQADDCSSLDIEPLMDDLGKLHLLRFLRLQGLRVTELPKSIGMLESLETLDIRGNESVIMLPVSFGKLGKLVRLLATRVELADGLTLENMKSLQVLVGICATNLHTLTEIGKLRELKSLDLQIHPELEWSSAYESRELIIMCLQMCSSLQELVLRSPIYYYSLDFMAQLSSGLQRFMSDGVFEEELPRWINSSLSYLTVLSIRLGADMLPELLEKLAELPSLRFLRLRFDAFMQQEKLIVPHGESAFPCLTDLEFQCHRTMCLTFQHGAMQKLQRLCLKFDPIRTIDMFDDFANLTSFRHVLVHPSVRNSPEAQYSVRKDNFDYGLENLPSLRHVVLHRSFRGCPEAENSIRKALTDHPNYPVLSFV